MHHLARLGCFDDEADAGAFLRPDQVMVNAGAGQERRDGRVVASALPVGENDVRCIPGLFFLQRSAQRAVERPLHASRRGLHREGHGQGDGPEIRDPQFFRMVSIFRLVKIGLLNLIMRQCSGVSSSRFFCAPMIAGEGHDQLFADRVDGRIGHLRKALLEIVEKRAAACRKRPPAAYRSPWSPVGSCAVSAMGVMMSSISSRVYPCSSCIS